jgi:hypothetical protein
MKHLHAECAAYAMYAVLVAAVSGCGGGGGGSGKTLNVDYSYPQSVGTLWRPTSAPVSAVGLEGSTPTCTIVTGRLPQGLSVQSNGCTITGTPTETTGGTSATVRMTVAGYSGYVDRAFTFGVDAPDVRYPAFPGFNFGSIRSWTPISVLPTNLYFADWAQTTGATVTYSVSSGALPDGLRLDPTTGGISGVLTSSTDSSFSYAIRLTATSVFGSYSAESPTYTLMVTRALTISYSQAYSLAVGRSASLLPYDQNFLPLTQTPGGYAFSNFRLDTSSSSMPLGLALNPATGEIAGTPRESGLFYPTIAADVTVGGMIGKIVTTFQMYVAQ